MVEITPEYKLNEFLEDFEYQDELAHKINFLEEAQEVFNECIKKAKGFNSEASFKIKIGIKPTKDKMNHMSVYAEITDKKIPKAAIEPAQIFIDQRLKLHRHGDPKQMRIDEPPKVAELGKGKEKA